MIGLDSSSSEATQGEEPRTNHHTQDSERRGRNRTGLSLSVNPKRA